VTVNDYLARRDQEWNGTIFEWLGLRVDCIDKHNPNTEERRNAYFADITYGTNNEFGFDYLRDNMVHAADEMVQRKRHYAIVDEELLFHIDEKNNQVDLTDKGLNMITKTGEDPEFFVMPDIGVKLAELEKQDGLGKEEILHKKEEILNDYAQKADRIHTVQQLVKSYTLFEKDVEYEVMDGAIKIVDEQTGRILEGRRYSDGLHQAIEAKENV